MTTKILYLCSNEGRKKIRMGILMSNPIAVQKDNIITVGKLEYHFVTIGNIHEGKANGLNVVGVMYDEPVEAYPKNVIESVKVLIKQNPELK